MANKISVIIPAYKAADYLEECLKSVNQQIITAPSVEFEILLGLDNCTETLTLIKKIIKELPNTKAIYFNEHLGPYVIRNTLASISNSDYFVFFDADDIMPQGFLQSMVKSFETHDLVRFGVKDFIEEFDGSQSRQIFNKNKIKQFQKQTLKQQAAALESGYNFFKKLSDFRESKYFKIDSYLKYINGKLTRRKSGVFAVTKAVFFQLGGYKAWPIEADVEFVKRAKWLNVSETMLPVEMDFLRRIHKNNLTSDYTMGMKSQLRRGYQLKSKTSVYEHEAIVTSSNYKEILSENR